MAILNLNPRRFDWIPRFVAMLVSIHSLVLDGIKLIICVLCFMLAKTEDNVLALSTILTIIDLAANCTLLSGVIQGNIRKCKIWICIKLFWLTGEVLQMVFFSLYAPSTALERKALTIIFNGLYTSSTEMERAAFQVFGILLNLILEIGLVFRYIKKLESEKLKKLKFTGQNGFAHSKTQTEGTTGFMQGQDSFPCSIFTIQPPLGIHAE